MEKKNIDSSTLIFPFYKHITTKNNQLYTRSVSEKQKGLNKVCFKDTEYSFIKHDQFNPLNSPPKICLESNYLLIFTSSTLLSSTAASLGQRKTGSSESETRKK